MKKLTALLALGALLGGTHALAGTVKFTNWPTPHSTGGGGPFNFEVETSDGLNGVPNSFLTFCLETNETITKNSVYVAEISTGAKKGGSGGATNGFDPISSKTAWLYNQYVSGSLVNEGLGVNSDGTFEDSDTATAFQQAIWHFEEEHGYAENKVTQYVENNIGAWSGIGNVRVLNLTKDGKSAQDVLTTVPIPGAVWLFGSALLGLAGLARRSA
jgi:hypothetical protein